MGSLARYKRTLGGKRHRAGCEPRRPCLLRSPRWGSTPALQGKTDTALLFHAATEQMPLPCLPRSLEAELAAGELGLLRAVGSAAPFWAAWTSRCPTRSCTKMLAAANGMDCFCTGFPERAGSCPAGNRCCRDSGLCGAAWRGRRDSSLLASRALT